MSALDLLTGGLAQASGLSLATRGLVVLEEIASPEGLTVGEIRVDARLDFSVADLTGDLLLAAGDLVPERTLRTALLLSLFLDRRVSAEAAESLGHGEDRRGWCLDPLARVVGDEYGSKLWLLQRAKATGETLNQAREYAREALGWLVEDGVVERVEVEAVWMHTLDARFDRGVLGLGVEVFRPRTPTERFGFVWAVAA